MKKAILRKHVFEKVNVWFPSPVRIVSYWSFIIGKRDLCNRAFACQRRQHTRTTELARRVSDLESTLSKTAKNVVRPQSPKSLSNLLVYIVHPGSRTSWLQPDDKSRFTEMTL
jgi:hypothetical protein